MTPSALPHYVGKILPDCNFHHGRIPPAAGVQCFQIARANHSHPALDDGTNHTYKHAADLAWFAGRFYVQYLTNPASEHTGLGYCVLASSPDAKNWEDFQISFPAYPIPACSIVDYKGITHLFTGQEFAFMHQRMCFFKSQKTGRQLVLAFYGYSPKPWMLNWDNYGIGRAVRELYPDGSLGALYFIRYNKHAGWDESLLNFPLYTHSPDPNFIAACEELLADPLATQQWAEEHGNSDPLIQIKHPPGKSLQAFNWYHISKHSIIALWKHSLTARSDDDGKTWSTPVSSPSLVMSGQKVFAQRTQDDRYAMVYDPTLDTNHRYPLCVTTSTDGLAFDQMLLVHGEVPPMRHGGFWKDMGPQYMRGIAEGLDRPNDNNLWITYSVNKEDIWIAKIPVPIHKGDETAIEEDFSQLDPAQTVPQSWNVYSPKWAKALLKPHQGSVAFSLSDSDPYDYCKVERVFAPAPRRRISFSITPLQNDHGECVIELCNDESQVAVRLLFQPNGILFHRVTDNWKIQPYQAGERLDFTIEADCQTYTYQLWLNQIPLTNPDGTPQQFRFMCAVSSISRVLLRTGAVRITPTLDTPPQEDADFHLPNADEPCPTAQYLLHSFSATSF